MTTPLYDPSCECGYCHSCSRRLTGAVATLLPESILDRYRKTGDQDSIAHVQQLLTRALAQLNADVSDRPAEFSSALAAIQFEFWQTCHSQLTRLSHYIATGSLLSG